MPGMLLTGIAICFLCLVAGEKFHLGNYKVPVGVRKVLVEELRFGTCKSHAVRNSSAKNDALLSYYPGSFHTGQPQEIQQTDSMEQERETKDEKEMETKKQHGRRVRGLRKRLALDYSCPVEKDVHAQDPLKHPHKHRQTVDPLNTLDTEGGPQLKIVGGDLAPGSWPFLASIQYLGFDMKWHHFCGGSLIHTRWVVTAAHCVTHIGDYYIRVVLGDYQLSKFSANREQVLDPERIFMHKYFNQSTYQFDIAMIKLQSDAELTKYVNTVAVATVQEVAGLDHTDTCYIAGWGNFVGTTTELYLSDFLQQSRMWVMPHHQCQAHVAVTIHDTEICISSQEASACTGDSGGPLVCLTSGEWLLVGAASYIVSPTCQPQSPNVFTRVSDYVQWMAGVIQTYDPALFNA